MPTPTEHPVPPTAKRGRLFLVLIVVAIAAAIIVAVVALATRAGGSSGQYSVVDSKVTVNVETIGDLGSVLVTNTGYALYTFPPDAQNQVTCVDSCAIKWPPLVVPAGAHLVAGDGVQAGHLAVVTAPNGDTVATYDGWPLYTFQGDAGRDRATGQAQFLDGGYWYVIRPDGTVVKPIGQ